MTLCLVAGPRSISKSLSETRASSKKGYADCLVICSRSNPSQLSESIQIDYNIKLMPLDRRNISGAVMYVALIGRYKGTNFSSWQGAAPRHTTDPAEVEKGLRELASFSVFTEFPAHQLSLFQASRQLSLRWVLQKNDTKSVFIEKTLLFAVIFLNWNINNCYCNGLA